MIRTWFIRALAVLAAAGGLSTAALAVGAAPAVAQEVGAEGPGELAGLAAPGFTDVAGNVHAASIARVAQLGIVNGYADGTFRPHEPVRRDQLATFIVAKLHAAGAELVDPGGSDFVDVAGNRHEVSIRMLVEAGVVQGQTPTRYEPRNEVTRAQVATLLWRSHRLVTGEELPAGGGGRFIDTAGSVHRDAIDALAAAGIVAGRGASFGPGDPVQRGAMATLVMNHLDVLGAGGHVPGWTGAADRDDAHRTVAFPISREIATGYRDDYLDARPGGRTHRGTDLYAPFGTEIRAVTAGVVRRWQPGVTHPVDAFVGGGYQVHVDTDPDALGIRRRDVYAHLGPRDPDAADLAYAPGIRPGVRVAQGQLLGWLGESGTASRPHLHFEMRWLDGPRPARDPGADDGANPGSELAPRWNPYPSLRAAEAAGRYPGGG